jgi:peptidyl-prolyl cis-trans isomerase C
MNITKSRAYGLAAVLVLSLLVASCGRDKSD